MNPEILTADEVAVILRIHVRTVYRLARYGIIPGRKLGGSWRFVKGEVMNFPSWRQTDHETS